MLWYIAIIAALNLSVGYLWAAYFRPCPRCAKIRELGAVLASASAEPRVTTKFESAAEPQAEAKVAPAPPTPVTPAVPAPVVNTEDLIDAVPKVEVPRDPVTGLATREHAEQLLDQLAVADTKNDPVTVALVEVDQIDWLNEEPAIVIGERVLCGVSIIARESLASNHTAARFAEQQLLLVVPHEDVHQATRRAEELRQRVATTEFVADGRSVQTTVTCALAEVSTESSGPRLMEFLQEALSEAKRYGGNRTFMHDGNSPTPVVPPELQVAPQQLAI